MTTRDTLHRLVDELPECEVDAAERYLLFLRNIGTDPVYRAFMDAPVEDEPPTAEDRAAIREAREEAARGEEGSLAEVEARLFGAA